MNKNKVILADENALFADALAYVLAKETDLDAEIINYADAAAIRSLIAEKPELIVIHQRRPDAGTLQMLREFRRRLSNIHILFIVKGTTAELFALAGENKNISIMAETAPLSEFMKALYTAARGERYIGRDILLSAVPTEDAENTPDPLRGITPREREVLYWLAHGLTNQEISKRMILSEKTIKNHVSSILKKLELTDRTKAAALAWREGLPQISEEFFSPYSHHAVLK